jgi:large subunit ribosomal protein L21
MFAVLKTGGKQYKVAENDVIKVEKLPGASNDTIEFEEILMIGEGTKVQVGSPLVSKAKVCATILEQARADKIIVFKKKRRQNYRRKKGHRQDLTVLRITDILPEGGSPKKKAAAPKKETESKTAEKKPAAAKPAVEKTTETKTASKPKTAAKKPAKKES